MIEQLIELYETNTADFADYLGVSAKTIRRWAEEGATDPVPWFASELLMLGHCPNNGEWYMPLFRKIENPLKELRKELNLSRKAFAEVIGVTSSTARKWEKEDCPSQVHALAHDLLLTIWQDAYFELC